MIEIFKHELHLKKLMDWWYSELIVQILYGAKGFVKALQERPET